MPTASDVRSETAKFSSDCAVARIHTGVASMDAFERSLSESETADGPFRTAEPTVDARLERARAASLERVAQATAEVVAREDAARRRGDRIAWAFLALSVLGLAVVVGLTFGTALRVGALVCPGIAGVLAASLVVLHRGRLRRASARE